MQLLSAQIEELAGPNERFVIVIFQIKLWHIPEEGLTEDLTECQAELQVDRLLMRVVLPVVERLSKRRGAGREAVKDTDRETVRETETKGTSVPVKVKGGTESFQE